MIILIDTDILIDLALDRAPFAEPAAALVDELEKSPGTAFMAWHSVSNFYYLVSPARGRNQTIGFLVDLARFIEIAPTTTVSLHEAVKLDLKDFEDALQVAAALACHAGAIVTRNLKDYRRSPIQAVDPQAALQFVS